MRVARESNVGSGIFSAEIAAPPPIFLRAPDWVAVKFFARQDTLASPLAAQLTGLLPHLPPEFLVAARLCGLGGGGCFPFTAFRGSSIFPSN